MIADPKFESKIIKGRDLWQFEFSTNYKNFYAMLEDMTLPSNMAAKTPT